MKYRVIEPTEDGKSYKIANPDEPICEISNQETAQFICDSLNDYHVRESYKAEPHLGAAQMYMRDYFAGQALIGLLQPESLKVAANMHGARKVATTVARLAYEYADTMMEVRKPTKS